MQPGVKALRNLATPISGELEIKLSVVLRKSITEEAKFRTFKIQRLYNSGLSVSLRRQA